MSDTSTTPVSGGTAGGTQGRPLEGGAGVEDPEYLSRQLITYIGNKRALLGQIGGAVEEVKRRLGRDRLRVFDAFSGSGVVSRYFKAHASLLVSNDLQGYAAVTGRCYLRNRSTVDFGELERVVADLNARVDTEPLPRGFIEELYSPADESRITGEDRVFYTGRNARRLDNYRRLIDTAPGDMRDMLLGPLLSRASVHANTAGVFKGFYKDRETGVGRFGGSGGDALVRIMGEIRLDVPVLSRFECECVVLQEDANAAARTAEGARPGVRRPAVQPAPVRVELLHAGPAGALRASGTHQPRVGDTARLAAVRVQRAGEVAYAAEGLAGDGRRAVPARVVQRRGVHLD